MSCTADLRATLVACFVIPMTTGEDFMLIYSLEVAAVIGRGFLQSSESPLDPVALRSRAWPHHCDYLLHINNAAYLKLMDYGRTMYFAQNRLLQPMLRDGFGSLVAGTSITYMRSIDIFEPYTLHTRVHYYDDDWLFFEQTFEDKSHKAAVRAIVRVRLRKDDVGVSFSELARAAGHEIPSMKVTEDVRQFESYTGVAIENMRR